MATLRRISWFNRLAILVITIGVIALLSVGQWWTASLFAPAIPILGWLALRSSRGQGSDYDRVSAAQPYDERDARATLQGFAWLGQFVFLAQIVLVFWATLTTTDVVGEALRLVAIGVVLGVANWVAVRRG